MHATVQPSVTTGAQTGAGETTRARLASVGLLLTVLALWIVRHGYLGIWHDARLYTLQALAHLKPDLLGNDIFLRFGSQDNYTLFSPLYAAVISLLGVEPAAALLTFVFHVAFFFAAWLLARRILPTNLALLAIGLLVALPSYYGGDRVFSYCEDFLTPRLPAEGTKRIRWLGRARQRLSTPWSLPELLRRWRAMRQHRGAARRA